MSLQHVLTLCNIIDYTVHAMEFPRQEYWHGLPFSATGDLPDPGIKLWSPTSQADYLPSAPAGKQKVEKLRKFYLHLES